MALKTNVYVSDVTNLTEARYYAGMGVSIIGFNATPEAFSYASNQQFDAITSWLAGIQTSWQWHQAPSAALADLVASSPADFIELSAVPTVNDLHYLQKPLLIRTGQETDLKAITALPKETVHAIIWEGNLDAILANFPDLPLFIQTEPQSAVIDSILSSSFSGIALKGSPEARPGWNDFDQLADLLESLETN